MAQTAATCRIGIEENLLVIDNSAGWLTRAKEILAQSGSGGYGRGAEVAQFAASMLATLYGPESPQLKQFQSGFAATEKNAVSKGHNFDLELYAYARGVIRNTVAELEAGLIVKLRIAVAGEILTELIRLAKEILIDKTDEAKDAAAVLTAAAYEGLIRRIGEEFANVAGRPKLDEVIGALKTGGIFKGATVGVAQSYLKLRNDSLHADWKSVERSQVESCLAFSESLLVKHFSDY
jgi:hypothetical protein